MTMLLDCLISFLRSVHLDALTKNQLAVMLVLMVKDHTCMETATETGYDRTTVRQTLQRLKQLGDVEMMPLRAAHGQVEYVYRLTDKGERSVRGWLGAFYPVMSQYKGDGFCKSFEDNDLLGNVK